jgi:hypothetical protein
VLGLIAAPGRAGEPAASDAGSVRILDAQKAGLVQVEARGQGEDHVQVRIHNSTDRRLRVVLPAGLVAAAAASQGFQSMGLGTPTRTAGSFGGGAGGGTGFRSVPADGGPSDAGIAVPAGKDVTVSLPSVCLNFGIPTPTPRDRFVLMDVDDYTPDARARKALRSLAALGTSQKVAQAVAWHVFNGMTLNQLARQLGQRFNPHELTVAARFIQALDVSGPSDLVEPAYFQQGRVFVRVRGEGSLGKDAVRLAQELDGQTLGGLPIRVVDETPDEQAGPSALLLNVTLASSSATATRGRVQAGYRALDGSWRPLGQAPCAVERPATELDGPGLAAALDTTLARNFVSAKVVRKGNGTTTVRLENRLPFTVASASLRTTKDADGGTVELPGLGLGPARSTVAIVPAAGGVVEHVEFNGL